MKILYFFASIVSPISVRRFKKMSIFFALLIFVIEFWMLFLPSTLYINRKTEYTASVYEYTDGLYNIKETSPQTFINMKQNNYKVENGELTSTDDVIKTYAYLYSFDERNICVYFVFDKEDALEKEFNDVRKEYDKLYANEESDINIEQVCHMAYLDTLDPENSLNDSIKKYHDMDKEALNDLVKVTPYYEFYNLKGLISNENYGYTFTKDAIIRSIDGNNDIFGYSYLNIDINDYNNISDFAKALSVQMIAQRNEYLITYQSLYIAIFVILLPMFLTLIMFLFTKKYKILNSLFEYYKMCSLLSILPALLTCIFSFIVGPGARNMYLVLLIVYTTTMLIKCATSDEADKLEVKYQEKFGK